MSTTQRIFDDAGGYRDGPTSASMYFGGDGHNHWHVQDLEDFIFRTVEIGDFRAEALNEGGNDFLKLSIEVRRGCDSSAICAAMMSQVKQKFELTPQVVILETGTLAKEFEANVKAARFLDRR